MKKIFVVLLILGIAGGAFAQFSAGFTAEFTPHVLDYARVTGQSAGTAGTSGRFDFLSSNGWRYGGANAAANDGTRLRIPLNWRGENFHVSARLRADDVLRAAINAGGTSNSGTFMLTNIVIDDWFVRATPGAWYFNVGNNAERGATDRYRMGLDDATRYKQEHFGIYGPNGGLDNNNIGRANHENYANSDGAGTNHWQLRYNFNDLIGMPLSLTMAGAFNSNGSTHAATNDYTRYNGAFRVSGNSFMDLVDFDVTYRFNGGDPTLRYNESRNAAGGDGDNWIAEFDGAGRMNHSIGLYAGTSTLVDGLMAAFGFSFQTMSAEDTNFYDSPNHWNGEGTAPAARWVTESANTPNMFGIDLRASFNMEPMMDLPLTASFLFNASFASIGATSWDAMNIAQNEKSIGFNGSDLDAGESQSWNSMFFGLGFRYNMSSQLHFLLQGFFRTTTLTTDLDVTSRAYGSTASTRTTQEVKVISNYMSTSLLAVYDFNSNVRLMGGLMAASEKAVTDNGIRTVTPSSGSAMIQRAFSTETGFMRIAIPLYFRVTW